jgi:DNA-binding ferritin-like protein
MTNFDLIAERIVAAEGVSFAIASNCGKPNFVVETREELKRAIVEALEDVLMDASNAIRDDGWRPPESRGDA